MLKNTYINNSDTGKVEEYDGVSWIEQGSGGTITVDAVPTDGSYSFIKQCVGTISKTERIII